MDFNTSMQISAIGMSNEKARIDVTSLNIANMNVPHRTDGAGYQPLHAVPREIGLDFLSTLSETERTTLKGQVDIVADTTSESRMVLEPGHPMADARGYVAYPQIDQLQETLTLMSALRAYDANVVAANVTKAMATRALDIGGQS